MNVAISRLHFPVTTLGPGRRIGLWFQGCSIRCPGCISVDTWEAGVGIVDVSIVYDDLDRHVQAADGLTVSGGEPFEQPKSLALVLAHWRARSKGSVLVFTGYEFDKISEWLNENPTLIDAVVTGPFRSDLPQTLAMRGSDNQRLHILSDLGREMLEYDRNITDADRRLDVMFDENGHAWMAGIPARGDLARLRRALNTAGHQAVTSAELGLIEP
jgi:anaerobic ribonucleoside-triphosphate reductase activating protein